MSWLEYSLLVLATIAGISAGAVGVLKAYPPQVMWPIKAASWCSASCICALGILWGAFTPDLHIAARLAAGWIMALVGFSALWILLSVAAGQSKATAIRSAYSNTQRITTTPSFMGGNDVLRLDDLATLTRSVPYSLQEVTMLLDVAPVRLPDFKNEHVEIIDTQVSQGGEEYRFDVVHNKRREITVDGRTFIVTLLGVRKLDTQGVSNPIEYEFGISER